MKAILKKRVARLRDPKNKNKRGDQIAIANAWANDEVSVTDLSKEMYGYRACSSVYVHLAKGLKAYRQDQTAEMEGVLLN